MFLRDKSLNVVPNTVRSYDIALSNLKPIYSKSINEVKTLDIMSIANDMKKG